jgi:undecaprenyl-diphosphatase
MEQQSLLEPAVPPERLRHDQSTLHPYRSALWVVLAGYAILALVLLGIGLLLTHALDGTVGRWDEHVNDFFARHRTSTWNDVTSVATAAMNTLPVVIGAFLVVGFLSLRHRFAEAVFLALSLVIEITVFLSVTFVVGRPRPAVPRLNSTPSTSSFPSGHTAAATVLFVGIAVIVACCTRKTLARAASALVAVAAPAIVGFSRVYRGLHHPTDVFVGFLFGLACLAVAAMAVRAATTRLRMNREQRGAPVSADENDQKNRLMGVTAASTSR